jgi:beta-glucuronidase
MFNVAFIIFTLHITHYTLHNSFAQEKPSSSELIVEAWHMHGIKDEEHFQKTLEITQKIIDLYEEEAKKQQASLKTFPKSRQAIEAVSILNDVGTAYFIQGEAYRDQGKNKEAIEKFKKVLYDYCFAQAWDPRGWFWKVAKASYDSIIKLNPDEKLAPCRCEGIMEKEKPKPKVSQIPTKLVLYDAGKEDLVVDYEKYGEFQNVGTKDYKYVIKDQAGLSEAVGEGIYPNTTSVRKDPAFKKALQEKRLEGDLWDFLQSPDLEASFFKWATSNEPQPVKLFYTGLILEKAGLIKQAIKCYYAILVHFPSGYAWTYWHTPWYVGKVAIAKINHLLRTHPQLGYKLEGAYIKIINGFDHDLTNDIVIADPGKFIKIEKEEKPEEKILEKPKIKKEVGKGKVRLVQYENGDWQLLVEEKPYVIRGITYSPSKVGQSPDEGTLTNWMEDDFNQNGKADGPYDAFVDKNRNNQQDEDEPNVGDFFLMKEMGVNTIRLYHHPFKVKKEILRDLYNNYGIRVIMGDFLGKYALGSGAPWNPGTDYRNEEHKKNMLDSVLKMVKEHKDEPYILFWLLGNENVYGYACNADKYPEEFFKFANEVAKKIKEIDPEHPVAICNGDVLFLDKFAKFCPDIDIFGTNAYRGEYGFAGLWQEVKEEIDKPVFITEFGCPAYAEGKTQEEAEKLQAEYHRWAWQDIEDNMALRGKAGNSLGGIVFEWLDEWWKAYEPKVHDTKPLWAGPFPDGFMHEEWLGLCSQGDGRLSPFLRQLRQVYYMYKEMWNKEVRELGELGS